MTRHLVLLLSFVVVLSCAKKEATTTTQAAAPAPETTSSAVTASPAPAPVSTPAAAPPAAATTSSGIASADGERQGTRVDVMELKRGSGGTVTLKMAFVNDSENAIGFGYNFADPDHEIRDHGSIGAVQLVDPVGKKKYFVARDSEGKCVCSTKVPDVAPHSRVSLWAKFPAPPDDVQKISIVIPHFQPLDDVAISH
ncbi:MAG: hypothetical protein JO093_00545 [Acidobacteria bacterium]|nr:hypothetical protein [Acidobacteriota bacterium]MBV9071646.1 hypothetical protein [Acidobacteriota bacterium]MBV9184071.1 hypothetical protein [Acidobacteriota bacterium]